MFTSLWANSADDKLIIFFLVSPENNFFHSMQIASFGDNLHGMPESVFWENKKKNISNCCLLKFLPSMLSVNDAGFVHC